MSENKEIFRDRKWVEGDTIVYANYDRNEGMRMKGIYCPECGGFDGTISNILDKTRVKIWCYDCQKEFFYKLEEI